MRDISTSLIHPANSLDERPGVVLWVRDEHLVGQVVCHGGPDHTRHYGLEGHPGVLVPDLQVPGQLVTEGLGAGVHSRVGAVCFTNKGTKVDNDSFSFSQHLWQNHAHHDSWCATVDINEPLHISSIKPNHTIGEVSNQSSDLDRGLLLDGHLHLLEASLIMSNDEHIQASLG